MPTSEMDLAKSMADVTYELLDRCQVKRERIASRLKLTVAEFKLILSFKDDTLLSVHQLMERMALSSSRLTRIVDGLVEKKFVRRNIGEKDRRTIQIILTPEGKKIQEELNAAYIDTHEEILDLLPQESREPVLLAMEKLRDAMKEWAND